MADDTTTFTFDRTALEVTTLGDEPSDAAHWRARPPEERLAAIELMRQINYDYDPATARLQRVLEVVERA
jgi:hypothetical protein